MQAQLHLVEDFFDAEAFVRWLGERRQILGCDTETGGFDWWREPLRLVQFGDLADGWAVPWELWGGLAMHALHRYDRPIVFHNSKFDVRYLETNGCTLRRENVHDTITMAHLLHPDQKTGLKYLGVKYVDPGAEQGKSELARAMTKGMWNWRTIPVWVTAYWAYAALDPVLTVHLYELFEPQIVGAQAELYDMEMACSNVVDAMERRGIRVDVPYCETKRAELLAVSEQTTAWCKERYGFGPGQNQRVSAQLMSDGVLLTKRTAGGSWSVDEEVLEGLDHPLAKAVLNVRKLNRYANAYFGNYVEYADGDILHTSINCMGARTGRMSAERPALQQIPRSKLVRDPFIPREGHVLVSLDYDQIEQRLVAHFSQDQGMIEAFASEGDFFVNMGRRLYDEPTFEKKDPRRSLIKKAAYAKAYLAGLHKFAVTAGVDDSTAAAFLQGYDATFPGVKVWQQKVQHEATMRAAEEGVCYALTPFGRRQVVPADKVYKLVNYLVQGTAGDVLKQSIVRLDRAGLTEHLVLPVHDELVFDVPKGDAEEFAEEARRIMYRDDLTVPMPASYSILHERWGDKYAED